MKKNKRITAAVLAAAMTASSFTMVAMAETNYQDPNYGWTILENRSLNGWVWSDHDNDGLEECYYYKDGMLQYNTVTDDGYTVDATGAWVVDGVVQTRQAPAKAPAAQAGDVSGHVVTGADSSGANRADVEAILAMLRTNGGGTHMESYGALADISTGAYGNTFYKPSLAPSGSALEGIYVAATDYSKVVRKTDKGLGLTDRYASGHNRSIRLGYEPIAVSQLQPNWLYMPGAGTGDGLSSFVPAPLLGMNKAAHKYTADGSIYADYHAKEYGIFVASDTVIDTTGSWVYDTIGTPSGSNTPGGPNWDGSGEVSRWRYRFIDGTYAANGEYLIYSGFSATRNDGSAEIWCDDYYFNENGWLITNAYGKGYYYDQYGRMADYTFGASDKYHTWDTVPNKSGGWGSAE